MTNQENSAATDEITQKVVDGRAWREFCDLLADAGESILAEGNPTDPLDRAEGFRMLTRLLRASLENNLEYGDGRFPQLICTCHETIKIVAENPDNLYLGSSIDGQYDYRVWGTRGGSQWISFNIFAGGGFGGGGPGVGDTLHGETLACEPDGTFSVILSQKKHAGNWLKLDPESRSLVIRQTFLDKKNNPWAELHIERIGAEGETPTPLTAHHLYRSLMTAGHYVKAVAGIGAQWATRQAQRPNEFFDEAQEQDTRNYKDPQIVWHQAYFTLKDDEALVIDFTPPQCDYWMIVLHNHWMETLDYVHHQATLNSYSAKVNSDESVRCVVAHRDPGVGNWLDTASHELGTVGVRWVGPNVIDVMPKTQVVKISSL